MPEKKQDGIVNPTKVKLLNRLLKEVKELLANEPTASYLDILDEETLPQNSDAVLIIGQHIAAMKQFREHHSQHKLSGGYMWVTEENKGDF